MDLVEILDYVKLIGCKWVYIKRDLKVKIGRSKSILVTFVIV